MVTPAVKPRPLNEKQLAILEAARENAKRLAAQEGAAPQPVATAPARKPTPVRAAPRAPATPKSPALLTPTAPPIIEGIQWESMDELTSGQLFEFLMLVGKDHSGKTSAALSCALYWELKADEAGNTGQSTWVISTEGRTGFAKVYRAFADAVQGPKRIKFIDCDNAYEISAAMAQIKEQAQRGDTLIVDSASSAWELAQDKGMYEVGGIDKAEYLALRRAKKIQSKTGGMASPIPQNVNRDGENYWQIVNGWYLGVFLAFLTGQWAGDNLNRVITAQLSKPPRPQPGRQPNMERLKIRDESGLDMDIAGSPKLPYKPDSAVRLERKNGKIEAMIFRDRGAVQGAERIHFQVPLSTDFAWLFYEQRGSAGKQPEPAVAPEGEEAAAAEAPAEGAESISEVNTAEVAPGAPAANEE